ncbi:MAG: class I tRNA ligase family protein, partial [Planctomycetota bacterium]
MTTDATDIPNRFDFAEASQRIYQQWQDAGCFDAQVDPSKKPFTIVIPPPNVTGALHLGHALNNTLQDILVRWRRMRGADALWQPGTDHAGIATQMVVERQLAAKGIALARSGTEAAPGSTLIGRDDFVARVWEWK